MEGGDSRNLSVLSRISSIQLSIEIEDVKTGLITVADTHSWVKAMAQIFSAQMGNVDIAVILDTAGATFTFDNGNTNSSGFRSDAAINDDTFGLLVGTGTTAVLKNDNTIETLIDDGTAAGELEYGVMVVSAALVVAGGYRVTLSRQFDNNSGGNITVKECGWVSECRDTSNVKKKALLIHDLQTQLINDTESKVFKYNVDFLF